MKVFGMDFELFITLYVVFGIAAAFAYGVLAKKTQRAKREGRDQRSAASGTAASESGGLFQDDEAAVDRGMPAGVPVTTRIKQVKQPYGGYVRPRDFEKTQLPGGGAEDLNPEENASPALVGLAVDYLTRFMTGATAREAFSISIKGAAIAGRSELATFYLSNIEGLDDLSIVSAMKLAGFDAAYRAGLRAYKPVEGIEPDVPTVSNVREMVERSLRFFDAYGPKTADFLTFEGGYTSTVSAGDGDFMTDDTLWDFKVSKSGITSKHTLQLAMYWLMGVHSVHGEAYRSIKYLGVYNPRLNMVYRLPVSSIPSETILEIEQDVIGYGA